MRKHPLGGKFDPNEGYCYFLATSVDRHTAARRNLPGEHLAPYQHVLVAVDEDLATDGRIPVLDELCDERKVLLDSGIYTLTMKHARAHGMHMNEALALAPEEVDGFDRLWDLYAKIASTYADRLWGVIELDLGGPTIKPQTRARIESELGIVPIPVFHPMSDGWDYYEGLVAEYDRVCVGNVVQASRAEREVILHAVYERAREHRDTWHHLLGVTPSPMLASLPVHGSSDSSTWLSGVRWMTGWKTGAATRRLGAFPPDMWYSSNAGNYYRVDGVALICSIAQRDAIRDMRAAQGAM